MNKLQHILLCCHEILLCREWGKNDSSFWPIQTEMDWAIEIQELIK